MRRLVLALVLGATACSIIHSSLLNFKVMIERMTHKNALIYFSGYGCYCGKGGHGQPRDKTDRCCYLHDCCYEALHARECHPYTDHYRYLIVNNDIICQYRNRSLCARLACECDRNASVCFRREAKSYNKKLLHYPGILCKEASPKCPAQKAIEGKEKGPEDGILCKEASPKCPTHKTNNSKEAEKQTNQQQAAEVNAKRKPN